MSHPAETTTAAVSQQTTVDVAHCSGMRQLVEALICLALAVILFRSFEVEGYLISSGSMAPSLLGHHKRAACPQCGYRFAVGVDHVSAGAGTGWGTDRNRTNRQRAGRRQTLATCPNCGQDSLDLSRVPVNQGDQLLVRKHAYLFHPPKRWETVVFRSPRDPTQAYVKRVVGLPGERVQILDGDVYVDGRVQRKDLAAQRALRIPVYDHDFQPVDDPEWQPRWIAKNVENSWTPDGGGFVFRGKRRNGGPSRQEWSWVEYRHSIRSGGRHDPQSRVTPVQDVYGYGSSPRGTVANSVYDLMLSVRVTLRGRRGEFILQMANGDHVFDCVFDVGRNSARLRVDGQDDRARSVRLPPAVTAGPVLIEMSVIDRQLLVAVDGRPLFPAWEDSTPPGATRKPPISPVRFAARELHARVESLKLFRDVYYTRARARHGVSKPYQLGDDEYFMLGDHSPISSDSRNWRQGGVSARLLLGKPFLVHLPSKPWKIRIGGWVAHIRIPDVARIRYIH